MKKGISLGNRRVVSRQSGELSPKADRQPHRRYCFVGDAADFDVLLGLAPPAAAQGCRG